MDSSDLRRLSVSLIDIRPGHEADFLSLSTSFEALLIRKEYGRLEIVRDEAVPSRYYALRYWTDVNAAERCHADAEAQALTAKLHRIARVTHIVNGVRRRDVTQPLLDERRAHAGGDRRSGFDRRVTDRGRPEGDRRKGDRRLGPRRVRDRAGDIDLLAAARRARENADAAYSHFKVGAALESGDGTIVTGCNIENATYGLTICAERVAMFKALSEGHRVFTRIAIVADTEAPTPPCGACRQILWEFGGNLEIELGNLKEAKGKHRLKDLLPLPFDARLL
ncbi:MAG TPA: cytidine deaminase [Vicinamibacterales bacterium]|nr:cytidine deaminase [Vicinamibacterales bacterium]